MSKRFTYLLIDAPFLCHRAFHTTGDLDNGTTYGFLRAVLDLRQSFGTSARTVFAFDGDGPCARTQLHSDYKDARREAYAKESAENQVRRELMRHETKQLRDAHLLAMGFANVFHQDGREADDIIAAVATSLASRSSTESVVIVTADKDLYQCVGDRVCVYNPINRKTFNAKDAGAEGMDGQRYRHVKAIAGCRTDGVRGVHGVGEKTARLFVQGKLAPEKKAYNRIVAAASTTVARNAHLVGLPFAGTKPPKLRPDAVTPEKWDAVVESLNLMSLRGKWA